MPSKKKAKRKKVPEPAGGATRAEFKDKKRTSTGSKKSGQRRKKRKSNFTKLTAVRIEKFLEILANNGGIVTDAAKDIRISRTALYNHRAVDKEFEKLWDEAADRGVDVIEDEAKRRALNGVREPVYYQGDIVGYIWKKSDLCISLILKAHRPKYRLERHELTGADGKPLPSNVIIYLPDNKRGQKNKDGGRQPS